MLRVMGLERKNVESLGFKFAEGLAVMGPPPVEFIRDFHLGGAMESGLLVYSECANLRLSFKTFFLQSKL